jgi:hypothetical protein
VPERRRLVRANRILAVATRDGPADLALRAAAVADPPPMVEAEPIRLLTIHTWQPSAEPGP